MPTELIRWICDKCGSVYTSLSIAVRCERSPDPKPPCKVGDEVRPWNRGHGSWTLAVCTGLRLGPSRLAEILADRADDVRDDANGFHEWQVKLDRHVYLDHAWEDQKDELPDFYLCGPGESDGLPREDNNSTGVPGYDEKDTLETT